MLPETSATFHGRDIFSPVGAHLAAGEPFEAAGSVVDPATMVRRTSGGGNPARPAVDRRTYVDSFGNLRLAGGIAELGGALGDVEPGAGLILELGAAGGGVGAGSDCAGGGRSARRPPASSAYEFTRATSPSPSRTATPLLGVGTGGANPASAEADATLRDL